MHSFISAYQFIGECEPRHDSSLLQPENGAKASAEKYTFDAGESHQPFSKGGGTIDPLKGPISFFLDTFYMALSLQKQNLLLFVLYECIDKQTVCLRVNVLHHDLKPIETPCFRNLNFINELLGEIL